MSENQQSAWKMAMEAFTTIDAGGDKLKVNIKGFEHTEKGFVSGEMTVKNGNGELVAQHRGFMNLPKDGRPMTLTIEDTDAPKNEKGHHPQMTVLEAWPVSETKDGGQLQNGEGKPTNPFLSCTYYNPNQGKAQQLAHAITNAERDAEGKVTEAGAEQIKSVKKEAGFPFTASISTRGEGRSFESLGIDKDKVVNWPKPKSRQRESAPGM